MPSRDNKPVESIGDQRKKQATESLRDKVDVLASFVAAGGVPEGYDWPGWESKHKYKRLEEKKMVVLTGPEALRFWHDPGREFKVKGRTVKGVRRIGSPSTLTANETNINLVGQAKKHLDALQKIADTAPSKVIGELKAQLEAKDALRQDITDQVAGVGLENKKLKERISRLESDVDTLNDKLEEARAEVRKLKGMVPFQPIPGGKDTDND